MTSGMLLVSILIGLTSTVIALLSYILIVRHRSVKDFMAHREGRKIMERVGEPKARFRICSCCGKDIKTAHKRPSCLRNPHHPSNVKEDS